MNRKITFLAFAGKFGALGANGFFDGEETLAAAASRSSR
jgi:hypothetical protein